MVSQAETGKCATISGTSLNQKHVTRSISSTSMVLQAVLNCKKIPIKGISLMNEEKLTRPAPQQRDSVRKKPRTNNFQARTERVQTEIDPNVAPLDYPNLSTTRLKTSAKK